ncbi:hypothetical protein [Paracraurococcus ruber]|uniref:Lipoprotein n=1 Tax=Paracraurococcus ruber TaxID=77675 RepID=A0ABS1CVP7_9PROT|nr:hypothetical protein [Paracraurococcus ruber]MBK1658381.1 hypothetical protein [Paracraurococcus ruber]TDG31051.1 hypothetical protein E2C05_12160 [Paracraurococcus ruber]
MRILMIALAAAPLLAACDTPARGPSTDAGLPVVTNPNVPGAGGVTPLARPAGSRGGDKGS